jgi:acyl-CoA synthetase (AMP-forming)/AMP-acid ligase II
MAMNIAGILRDQARAIGDRPAIVERGGAITFAELEAASASAAAALFEAGLRPGMRALVVSPMSIALYATVIALFRLRVTAIFLDPSADHTRLDDCVCRVRPDALAAVPRAHFLRLKSPAIRAIAIKIAIGGWFPGARSIDPYPDSTVAMPVEPCDDDAPAIMTFTSGSTGRPKAAVRSHGFLIAQHRALVDSFALEPGEVDLTTLPVVLLANLASGVTSLIPDTDLRAPGSIDAGTVLDQIQTRRPTRTAASPAFLLRLAHEAARRRERLDSFRRIFTGGAPVFPRTLDALATVAPDASIVAVYGSTEAEPIAAIDRRAITMADRASMRSGAGLLAGAPVSSIALRIEPDRDGSPAGDIVVSGDHVLRGYLDGTGDEETKIREGDRVWHRTGDAGYLDRRGRLWLLGRCAERVSDDRGVLYPFAVEAAASDISGIERSAFVRHRGRRLLVVEPDRERRSPGETRSLRESLLTRLAWAHLENVTIVERIPVDKRHNAKVDYPALREMLPSLGRRAVSSLS